MKILVSNGFIFIALNRSVISFNLTTKECKTFIVPPSTITPENKDIQYLSSEIEDFCLSSNGEIGALTTKDKSLYVLNGLLGEIQIASERKISRVSSAMKFLPDNKSLLLTDKSGDCYIYELTSSDTTGKWILGHLSIVLDVLITPDENSIITSDRDEKIKVSQYPDCHEIEAFCLGHTEFVSSIGLLPHDDKVLLSISGDGKIKLWNYKIGALLKDIELERPGLQVITKKISSTESHVFAVCYELHILMIYKITGNMENLQVSLIKEFNFGESKITSAGFYNNVFFVPLVTEKGNLTIKKLEYLESEEDKYVEIDNLIDSEIISKNLGDVQIVLVDDVAIMFKKRFDNMTSYHERKKIRFDNK